MAKDVQDLDAQARRIRELRDSEHLTQPEVATKLGVSLRGYQAWEAADSDPSLRNLKALAAFFKVSPDFISLGFVRPKAAAPDVVAALDGGRGPRLERIETELAVIVGMIEHQVGAQVLKAVRADIETKRRSAS